MNQGGICSYTEFVKRGECAGWDPALLWVHNATDMIIFVAYCIIAFLMVGFIRRRHDDSLGYMFWLFGLFILSCGVTHLSTFLTTWWPAYRLDAVVKVVCAALSAATATLLIPLTPKVMRVHSVAAIYKKAEEQEHEIARLRSRLDNST